MFKKIISLSRPRFWLYTLGPYLIGISAVNDIHSLKNVLLWYGFFYFLIPANIFIYAINDYSDQNIDQTNPKKHLQENYMKSVDAIFYKNVTMTSAILCIPLLFDNVLTSIVLTIFMFFSFFYSSVPIRFKAVPFIDSASNFFYILPGVIGYIFIFNTLPPLDTILAGCLWTAAMHLFSAIVDIPTDSKTGIKTTATVLGYTHSLIATSILWLLSIVLILKYSPFLMIGCIYPFLSVLILIKKYNIEKLYWLFPKINMILGFILFCIVLYKK